MSRKAKTWITELEYSVTSKVNEKISSHSKVLKQRRAKALRMSLLTLERRVLEVARKIDRESL